MRRFGNWVACSNIFDKRVSVWVSPRVFTFHRKEKDWRLRNQSLVNKRSKLGEKVRRDFWASLKGVDRVGKKFLVKWLKMENFLFIILIFALLKWKSEVCRWEMGLIVSMIEVATCRYGSWNALKTKCKGEGKEEHTSKGDGLEGSLVLTFLQPLPSTIVM